jgi:NTE family protein
VLGGGGVTGIAWELGVIAGLAGVGVDLTTPDLVIGTSAGSVVGAQILSDAGIDDLYQEQLADPKGEVTARIRRGALLRLIIAALWPGDGRGGSAYLGRAALKARTVPEAERRAVFESRLRSRSWPERRLVIVAVDAMTGEPKLFDRDSGVHLVDAVAASCAVPIVWPPMTVEGRRYIDGGVRSITNVDLAVGCDRVVVLAPVTFSLQRRGRISSQLSTLGPQLRSFVASPDAQARAAIGMNVLDPAHRSAAAQAGRRQGAMIAREVAVVWS